MEKKEMTLKEYQNKAMRTCLPSINGERLNKYGNLVGSYFPKEHYCFEQEDNLQEFVVMLKNRGYYIGEDGHIRGKKGVLSSKLMRNGYYMTSATYKKKTYYYMEHRVVWCWHNGAIPQGMVINHKDYNRANNCIDNLEMVSQKENVEYSRCHFNPCKGERGRDAKFTNAQASAIKTLGLNCGWSISKIADLIGEEYWQ